MEASAFSLEPARFVYSALNLGLFSKTLGAIGGSIAIDVEHVGFTGVVLEVYAHFLGV